MGRTGWTTDDIPDLDGLTVVVTGANSGIGKAAATGMAGKGANVVLACRSLERAKAARQEIEAGRPRGGVEILRLDLSSQAQIADASSEALERFPTIDRLINNAGVMNLPLSYTEDHLETVFGTNHVGPFAFTGRILPALLAAPGSRIVTMSSLSHRFGRMRWDDLSGANRYSRSRAYAQSKLANLLFAFELQRRLHVAGTRTISLAAHPGQVATSIGQSRDRAGRLQSSIVQPLARRIAERDARPVVQRPLDGALPALRAATDPAAYGGQYYGPAGPASMTGPPVVVPPARRALDVEVQMRLWRVTEELTGVAFPV